MFFIGVFYRLRKSYTENWVLYYYLWLDRFQSFNLFLVIKSITNLNDILSDGFSCFKCKSGCIWRGVITWGKIKQINLHVPLMNPIRESIHTSKYAPDEIRNIMFLPLIKFQMGGLGVRHQKYSLLCFNKIFCPPTLPSIPDRVVRSMYLIGL